jgi:hypothetical protein
MSTTLHGSNGATAQQHEEPTVLKPFGHISRALRSGLNTLQQARVKKNDAAVAADSAETEAYEATVELEAEQLRVDPSGSRRGSFSKAVTAAILLTLGEVVPAWWAAEALGGGLWATAIVAVLLVAALAGLAALLSHFKHDANFKAFDIARAVAALLVLVESGLRLVYLLVTSNVSLLQAALEVGLLALVTTGLIWVSYVILVRAESIAIYKQRCAVEGLQAKARATRVYANTTLTLYQNHARALNHVERNRLDRLAKLDKDVESELDVAANEGEK